MTVATECREATLDQVQAGIKQRLETIEGLRAFATEPDQPVFPCGYPRVVSWTFDTVYDDDGHAHTDWVFDVWILVGVEPSLNRAQTQLNAFLSPRGHKSVRQAIEADFTLGRQVDTARVTGGGNYGRVEVAGVACLGASVRLEVSA